MGLTSEQALRATLTAMGGVAVTAGAHMLLTGMGGVLQAREADGRRERVPISPNVDSELRFFSSWYIGAGALLLRSAKAPSESTTAVRTLCGLLLLSAVGRVLSIASVGRPHRFFLVLMGLEFALPAVVVPWQASLNRKSAR